ncbi:CRAL/TRIO, N-terminal domain [Dillenia turbinata]|uniref:CRAL/TRIO, N-terminal domain n=1 Tax=Dillenia turbinata TaxID=194707 RepID=A0AAN8VQ67_9MAGN
MWGIPLLGGNERADVILLKFLRARDFRVLDSLHMLEKCLLWRKDFGADSIVEEDLGFKELEGLVAHMHGYNKEGYPVVLERGINLLHFKPVGINSLVQVTDLKDMPMRELKVASNQILSLFQDKYPEMVARKIT